MINAKGAAIQNEGRSCKSWRLTLSISRPCVCMCAYRPSQRLFLMVRDEKNVRVIGPLRSCKFRDISSQSQTGDRDLLFSFFELLRD